MYILHICTSFTKEILEDVTCEKKKKKKDNPETVMPAFHICF